MDSAPLGPEAAIHAQAAAFTQGLDALIDYCLNQAPIYICDLLKDILIWEVGSSLDPRVGSAAVLKRIYPLALRLAERLSALEPDNTQFLRDLCSSCHFLAGLETADASAPLGWWRKGAEAATTLAMRQPTIENRQYLSKIQRQVVMKEMPTNPTQTLRLYEETLQMSVQVFEETTNDPMAWGLLASVLSMIAEWHLDNRDPKKEKQYSHRADGAMNQASDLNSGNVGSSMA